MKFTVFITQFIDHTASFDYPVIHQLNNEKSLISDLLLNYKVKYGRPVSNMTEKVMVYIEVGLIQLIDLVSRKFIFININEIISYMIQNYCQKDERNQVLITNVQTKYVWKDNSLRWNPDDYGGLDYVHLPVENIWTPDIVLYNYADTRLEEKRKVLVTINSDGKVKWIPPSIFKSTCQINIELFPYDQQNCSMKFGSWTYDGDSIDIQFLGNSEMNTDLYLDSNEWDIVSTKGQRNEKKYECCIEFFPDM